MKQKLSNLLQQLKTPLSSILSKLAPKTQQLQFTLMTPPSTKKAKIPQKIQIPKNRYLNLQQYLLMYLNSTSQNGRANGESLIFVTGMLGVGKTQFVHGVIGKWRKGKEKVYGGIVGKGRRGNKLYVQEGKQLQHTTLSSPQYLQNMQRSQQTDNPFSFILSLSFPLPSPYSRSQPPASPHPSSPLPTPTLLKPQAFFHILHTKIIQQLLVLSNTILKTTETILLDQWIIKEIVLANNAGEYLLVFVKEFLNAGIKGCWSVKIQQKDREELEKILEEMRDLDWYRFFGSGLNNQNKQKNKGTSTSSLYQKLIQFYSTLTKKSKLQSSLNFFLQIFRLIEYNHRQSNLATIHSGYETGIETTKYLFDILDYICGFGNLNKSLLSHYLSSPSSSPSPSPFPPQYSKYYLSHGTHIDTILTLHHLQTLSCYNHPKFKNWFDHVIIWAQTDRHSKLRTRFPIVIELGDCWELQQIQRMGRFQVDSPTVVEVPGYFRSNLHRYMISSVFNQNAIKKLRPVLGRNPSVWNQAILQLSKGTPIKQIILKQAPFLHSQTLQRSLFSKLNKLYLQPQIIPMLDDIKTLHFQYLQTLQIMLRWPSISTLYLQYRVSIFSKPIFQYLLKQNICYDSYYFNSIDFTDSRYSLSTQKYHTQLLHHSQSPSPSALHALFNSLQYRLWKIFNKNSYQYNKIQLKYKDKLEMEQVKQFGAVNNWRAQYQIGEYFGALKGYRVLVYEEVAKSQWNL